MSQIDFDKMREYRDFQNDLESLDEEIQDMRDKLSIAKESGDKDKAITLLESIINAHVDQLNLYSDYLNK